MCGKGKHLTPLLTIIIIIGTRVRAAGLRLAIIQLLYNALQRPFEEALRLSRASYSNAALLPLMIIY